jgi:DNA polymerase elongation subunit (family B)
MSNDEKIIKENLPAKTIEFQILDWNSMHDEDCDDEGNVVKTYVIKLYGRTRENKSIFVKVTDYTPYFFVEIPKIWKSNHADLLMNDVKNKAWPKENKNGLLKYEIISRYNFYGFTNFKKFNYLKLTFQSLDSMRSYSNVFRKPIKILSLSHDTLNLKLVESNIEPLLRCMHIRQLDAVGWVKIKTNATTKLSNATTCCDINIQTKWTNLERVEDRTISPFVIASFDIECNSEDGSFPQAGRDGDQIIQIGTTFNRFGESECFYQHMITLGSCDPIEGAVIESYATEQEVLAAWTKMIRKMNPDIITGYNIFGFDFQYMKDRAAKLGISHKFEKLSRDTNHDTKFEVKELASSALGENILKYYDMHGRIVVDLMKVIQRDHKLESYKLDYVAAWFIREEVKKIEYIGNNTLIHTKNTYGVKEGNFITIFYNDGLTDNKHMDGEKFQILKLESDKILVDKIIDDDIFKEKSNQIYWCNAKDDISPNEIFECQKQTSKERAKIAKYCLMDCVLCNKLMNKLQVITNNVGMANVCNVPLSYLFMRGQGVKIFSLVAKKCREKQHLIPNMAKKKKTMTEDEKKNHSRFKDFVSFLNTKDKDIEQEISKKEDEEEEEDDGYEGATVFPPKSGVHYEPIPVLDYASLYPNSMILRNMSHEMLVNDPKYDNLEGYIYHQITYKNNDGTFTTCRFAEKADGTKGIIPEILIDLLTARKKYKKEMENEKDPFKKSILDGLQQAYKVTANSLYGQTGSPVSSIYMKEIAASTTATGREMLLFSKYFIQEVYSKLVNLALTNKTKFFNFANEVFKTYPTRIVYDDVTHEGVKEKIDIHVSTFENKEIPESKFNNWKDKADPEDIPYMHKNKEEFLQKLYVAVNSFMKGYSIAPRIIYGDSVVGDTPILFRNKNTKEVIIKTIDTLATSWKSYNEFKIDQVNLTDKEQNKSTEIDNLEVWTDFGWSNINRIIRHKTDKKIFRIITKDSAVDVTEDHSLISKNGKYLTPKQCVIGQTLKETFPNLELQSKDLINTDVHTSTSKLQSMYSYLKFRENKYNTYLDYNHDSKTYKIYSSNEINNSDEIVQIIDLGCTTDYVYDLETEVGHFHAGVGQLIVKNTDSVFYCAHITDNKTGEAQKDQGALEKAIQLGIWSSKCISSVLPPPMAQEYEKVLWPFAIITKKRYVGNLYEKNPKKFKQKSMGIVLKRRDNAPIVKVVCGGVIKKILNDRSPQKAVEFTRKTLKDILANKYPIEKYIITKTLKSSYKDRSSIVHAVLADIMAERDPGNKPQSNDRIPYVYKVVDEDLVLSKKYKKYVDKKNKVAEKCKCDPRKCECYKKICSRKKCINNIQCVCFEEVMQSDRVEHPTYLLDNKLRIDYLFYITNQIMKPTMQFLDLIMEDPNKIFDEYIVREQNRRKKQLPLSYYFGNKDTTSIVQIEDNDKANNNDLDTMINEYKPEIKQKKKITRKKKSPVKEPTLDGLVANENGSFELEF